MIITHSTFSLLVATIGLESSSYSVREDDLSINVTVILAHGELGRDISFTFSTQDGTALSPADYAEVVVDPAIFPAGAMPGQVLIFTLPIVDDVRVEYDEIFEVVLTTLDTAVEISIPTANVTISNDDCKLVSKPL